MVSLDFMEDLFLSMLLALVSRYGDVGKACVFAFSGSVAHVFVAESMPFCVFLYCRQRQRSVSDPPDSAISTSHILHGAFRITNGVRRGTWPEFWLSDIWECPEHLFLIPWWLRVLPKELDEKVENCNFHALSTESGIPSPISSWAR